MSDSDRSVMSDSDRFLEEAIALAHENVRAGGRPFGAVVVRDGRIIARGVNEMHLDGDPTAHAELLAVRAAIRALGAPRLDGCTVYASGQPCPMCFAAMRMYGVSEIVFGYSNADGEPYGLSTAAIAEELRKPFAEQAGVVVRHVPPGSPAADLYGAWAQQRDNAP